MKCGSGTHHQLNSQVLNFQDKSNVSLLEEVSSYDAVIYMFDPILTYRSVKDTEICDLIQRQIRF
jgi:hypothetical protein